MKEAFIVAACRTAGGRRNGRLSGWHPADLAGRVLDRLLEQTRIDPYLVDDVVMGCVGQAGEQSNNVARNAVLSSRLPEAVPATSVDRQCGSSQQAVHFAAQAVMSGTMDCVIAAGVESMSRVPMMMPSDLPRQAGLGDYVSSTMKERYPGVQFSQFKGAQLLADLYRLSKNELDEYSLHSHRRAALAASEGRFASEILPLEVRRSNAVESGVELHVVDEGIRFDANLEAIASVKPLEQGGTITAANASQICDGAAGVMLMSYETLKSCDLQPLARIHSMSVLGHDPVIMLEAPIPATRKALLRAGLRITDIDAFEVNEAFAPVPLAWLKASGADPDRLNVHGGAIALGHPLGASGARLMVTLINVLQQRKWRYGLQTMCEGGGMANVTIIERL